MAINPAELPVISEMSDRELLEEVVTNMRAVSQAVEGLAQHPMIAAIAGGASPFQVLTGRG